MEYIDVINSKTGEKTGEVKSRSEVHLKGLWHRNIHIFFVNSKRELLMQHRSRDKESNPNMWDISAAGHILSGEEAIDAALREIREEIGISLSPSDLKIIGETKEEVVLNNGTYINNEFINVYLVMRDFDINQFEMVDREVQKLKWVPLLELKNWLARKSSDIVQRPDDYNLFLKVME